MRIQSPNTFRARRAALAALTVGSLLTGQAAVAQPSLGPQLCSVLAKLIPEVRGFKPEGVRAQLVMAIAEKFDYDAKTLQRVKAEIDAATTASCPKERGAVIEATKMKSLSEAVS